jgi:ADP-ribose pyrophosphatase
MRRSKIEELKNYIEKLKTIKVEEIPKPQEEFITVKYNRYHLNDGHNFIRGEILKDHMAGNAVTILPITKQNNIIITIEPRVLTKEGVSVGIPSGYLNKGEKPNIGVLRELQEETGYSSKIIKQLGKGYYQDEGTSRAFNRSYIASDCEQLAPQHLDSDEFVEVMEVTPNEAYELIEMGYISGANSIITFERAKAYFKR